MGDLDADWQGKLHWEGGIQKPRGVAWALDTWAGKSPAAQNRIDSTGQRRKEVDRPQASQQEHQREHHVRHCTSSAELNMFLLPWDRVLASAAKTAACMSAAVGPGHGCWNTLLVNKTILSKPTQNPIFHFHFCSAGKQFYFLRKLVFSP